VAPAKRRTFGEFLRCLPPPTPPARLLEVGCAAGDAVRVAADLGYTPLGVDPGRDAIARARRRFPDLEFREGGLDDAVGRDERFVAIAMFDVIEHIPEPHAFADALTARLAPGGRLLVVTPNAASLSARALGGRWFHAFTEHVVLYSAAALDRLFLSRGLRRERLEFAWKWVSAEMLRRHALVHPHIAGGGLIAGALGALPAGWRARLFPFNIGELLAVYRRDP
jgi:SAM-dependent methyltransferase